MSHAYRDCVPEILRADRCAPGGIDVHPVLWQLREVESLIQTLVASWHDFRLLDARSSQRVGFRRPIAVTPIDDRRDVATGPTLPATGRDISPAGMSFVHRHLLPCKRVAATFALPDGNLLSASVRLTWCRFTTEGRYKSGGKLLRVIPLVHAPEELHEHLLCHDTTEVPGVVMRNNREVGLDG